MKLTSAEANKILKKLQEDRMSLIRTEKDSMEFNASVNEDPESVRPEYNYQEIQEKKNELDMKIRLLKHSINKFNVTTELANGMTIDQALIRMPQLTELKERYAGMKDALKKRRDTSPFANKYVIDYVYINYDREKVRKDYERVCKELQELQLELDDVNNSVCFEADI